MKTKDTKQHEYTFILGKGCEISRKIRRNFEKRAKSPSYIITPLAVFENYPLQFKWDKSCSWGFHVISFLWFLFSGSYYYKEDLSNPSEKWPNS